MFMKKMLMFTMMAATVINLVACGDTVEPVPVETVPLDSTTTESEPIHDLGGFTLNIAKIPQESIHWVLVSFAEDEENGDVLNDAFVKRNREITEKYNFNLVETEIDDTANMIQKMVSAGDDEYQVMFSSIPTGLISSDILLNVAEVETLDLDSDCWDQNMLDTLSIGDSVYLLGGDITVADEDSVEVIVYNTSYANTLDIENLYETVESGTWTIDKLLSCMKLAAADINGDSKMDLEDSYGLISNNDGISAMLASCGVAAIAKNENGIPEIMADSDRYVTAFTKLAKVFDASVWHSYDGITADLQVSRLENHQQLFVNAVTSFARRFLRDVETDFGFLPTPKLDDAQEQYYSASVPSTCVLAIPASCGYIDNTGLALQLLAEGSGDLSYTYYDICLQSKYTRDVESYDMLKLATENIIYDIGYFYDAQFGMLHTSLIGDILKGGENLSSIVAKKQKMTEEKIKIFYKMNENE